MASASVLQRLTERARQAEEIIAQLKSQIESTKQAAAISVSRPVEDQLRAENTALRVEVDQLKTRLVYAEIKNGVKQVPLPSRKATQSAGSPAESEAAPPAQPQQNGEPAGKQQQQGNEKKQKQQKQQKGNAKKAEEGGEPKPKKGGNKPAADAGSDVVDITRLLLKVGKIVAVKKHPDADSLYVEEVDLGEGQTRTIVSGLVKHVPIEEMQDRLAIFMCNLKAAKMRGILSNGMIMCANCPEKVEILLPPPGAQIGDVVNTKGYTGEPDTMLNPKKKIWEAIKPDLMTDAQKVAAYKGAPLYIDGKGQVLAPTRANTQIS